MYDRLLNVSDLTVGVILKYHSGQVEHYSGLFTVFTAGAIASILMLMLEIAVAKVTNKKERDKKAIALKRKTAHSISVRQLQY